MSLDAPSGIIHEPTPPHGRTVIYKQECKGSNSATVFDSGTVDFAAIGKSTSEGDGKSPLAMGAGHRGGWAIVEFEDGSQVGLVTTVENGTLDLDNPDFMEVDYSTRRDLDGTVSSYVVGPGGSVVKQRSGAFGVGNFPSVIIGERWSYTDYIAGQATKSGIDDPSRFTAFANRGRVKSVIVDNRAIVRGGSDTPGNPFLEIRNDIKRDVARRAATST